MVDHRAAGRAFATDLEYDDSRHGSPARTLRLFVPSPEALLEYPEVRIIMATFERRARLERAVLEIGGSSCVYETQPGARLRNNQPLALFRGAGCNHLGNATGELTLTVHLLAPTRVAVWALLPAAGVATPGAIHLGAALPAKGETRSLLRGEYVEHLPYTGTRRIDLLQYVWQLDVPTFSIPGILLMAAFLFASGAWLFIITPEPRTLRRSVSIGIAGFGLSGALGLAYAVAVPPFQAADEPNHFIGFAAFVGREGMDVEAAMLARLGHFERLQFRARERFRPSDIGHLGPPWDDGGEPDSATRGRGVEWLWTAVAPMTRDVPAARVLLILRIINVLWFAGCVGLLFFALAQWSPTGWPQLLAAPLLWIPTLAFFGMHVSNHALLAGVYLVAGAGVLLLALDGRDSHVAGPLIGIGSAAAILISRAAAPMAPFIAVLLAGRLLLGAAHRNLRAAMVFWLGVLGPLSLALTLGPTDYFDTLFIATAAPLPDQWSGPVSEMRRYAWLLLPAAPLLAAGEHVVSGLRQRITWRLHRGRMQAAVACTAMAALMLFAGSVFVPYPMLGPIDPANPPDWQSYVGEALAAGLTVFRFGRPDWFTSYTFWGAFGWLDTLIPEWLVRALAGGSGAALVGLLLWLAFNGTSRQLCWLVLVLVGYLASLAAYAGMVLMATPADLHGRYLLGLYCWLLLVCWSSLALVVESRSKLAGWIPSGCVLLVAAVHGLSLSTILQRYF